MSRLTTKGVDAPAVSPVALDSVHFKDGVLVRIVRQRRWLAWPPGPRRARVLVVDDERDIAIFFSDFLVEKGYQVARAFNGTSGLAAARALLPDLILLNVIMPGMSGDHVLRELRRDAATRHIKVILTSACHWVEELARIGGAQDHLRYPCTLDAVLLKVERHLGG